MIAEQDRRAAHLLGQRQGSGTVERRKANRLMIPSRRRSSTEHDRRRRARLEARFPSRSPRTRRRRCRSPSASPGRRSPRSGSTVVLGDAPHLARRASARERDRARGLCARLRVVAEAEAVARRLARRRRTCVPRDGLLPAVAVDRERDRRRPCGACRSRFADTRPELRRGRCRRSARWPSTATIASPGRRAAAAGEPCSIVADHGRRLDRARWPTKTPARITNASAMLTTGPAAITTIRFHTGWR